jgi:hypothetical protein
VNRLAAVIAATALTLAVGGFVMYRSSRPASPAAPAPAAAANRAAPAPAPAPKPGALEVAAPAATPERPAARRAPAPAPRPAESSALAAPAEAMPDTATLTIASDVPGAQVFLDRQFVGVTPLTARDIAPCQHQLNVSAPGFDNHAQTIDLTPGPREITINFREIRLDASIDVVHKHRMGSCRGRLVATPGGLRYDTTDKDDVFTAALLDLETFQVDYLSKNLRIQPRKGKRYDFSDPDGNADRLFVFHRDVDRARERLKKGDVSPTREH